MSSINSLKEVIENDLCIACGACLLVENDLALQFNEEKMMYEPSGPGGAEEAAVCPSVRVDFAALQAKVFPNAPVGPLGVVESVMLAQSTNHERNLRASSGGLIKELLLEFLSRDEVDGVIALTHIEGLLFEPRLITSAEEVDALPGSIYHNVPFEKALRLLVENKGKFVLVAIPCQLEGIYNYIHNVRPELADRIYATIGLVCGWTFTHHAIKAVCEFKGVDYDRIENIAFRGGGPVGRLSIKTPDKETRVNRRVDFGYQVAFDRSFNIPRCHLCVNHTNVLADLVVGDAWLPSTVYSRSGVSLVICRNAMAEDAMRALGTNDRVRFAEVTEGDVIESQTRRVAFGDFAYAYAEYLKKIGQYCPDMVGPNRASAEPVSRRAVEKFHRETKRKIQLQRQGRYRLLWWRKATVESGRFLYRYVRWFFVRVLRVKSLFGARKEISKSQLADFL